MRRHLHLLTKPKQDDSDFKSPRSARALSSQYAAILIVTFVSLFSLLLFAPSWSKPRVPPQPPPLHMRRPNGWRGAHHSIENLGWDDAQSRICHDSLFFVDDAPANPFSSLDVTILDTLPLKTLDQCCAQCALTSGCLAFLSQADACQLVAVTAGKPLSPQEPLALPHQEEVPSGEPSTRLLLQEDTTLRDGGEADLLPAEEALPTSAVALDDPFAAAAAIDELAVKEEDAVMPDKTSEEGLLAPPPQDEHDNEEDELARTLLNEDSDSWLTAATTTTASHPLPSVDSSTLLDDSSPSSLLSSSDVLLGDDSSLEPDVVAVTSSPSSLLAEPILDLVDAVADELAQDMAEEDKVLSDVGVDAAQMTAEDAAVRLVELAQQQEEGEEELIVLPPSDDEDELLVPVTDKRPSAPPVSPLDALMAGHAVPPAREEPRALGLDDLLAEGLADAVETAPVEAVIPSKRALAPQKPEPGSVVLEPAQLKPTQSVPQGEQLESPQECAQLAKAPMAQILPPGLYNLVVADPFYKLKIKFFGRFRAVSEVHAFISEWQAQYSKPIKGRPWQVDTFTLGRSAEDLPIRAVEFGNPRRGRHVFIVAGLRGCDWIGPLAAVHAAVALVGRRQSTKALLDAARFHVIPLVNVDGYHFSRRKSPAAARHWCDNRRISAGGHGTNLERNWGVDGVSWGFGKKGKDSRKDKHGFQGVAPFSEPEVRAVRDYVAHFATGPGRLAVLHVRCCAGLVTLPMTNETEAVNVAEGGAQIASALKQFGDGRNEYAVVKRPPTYGPDNTGQFVDWAHSLGAEYSYVVELKATNVATHMDRYQIETEPFNALTKELEVAMVTLTQLMVGIEVKGMPATTFKPKVAPLKQEAAAGAAAAKSKTTKKKN